MNGDKEILCGAPRGAVSAEAMKAIAKPFLEAKDNRYEAIISLAKERDTYRDLCAKLLEDLCHIKLNVSSPLDAYYIATEAVKKAEAILGDKNGR